MVLDSGFCVVKGIVELRKRSLFACLLIKIKKQQYWPALVAGGAIQQYFNGWEVGDIDAAAGMSLPCFAVGQDGWRTIRWENQVCHLF